MSILRGRRWLTSRCRNICPHRNNLATASWGENPVVTAKLRSTAGPLGARRHILTRPAFQPPHTPPRHRYQCLLVRSPPRRAPAFGNMQLLAHRQRHITARPLERHSRRHKDRQSTCLRYQLQCAPRNERYGWPRLLELSTLIKLLILF